MAFYGNNNYCTSAPPTSSTSAYCDYFPPQDNLIEAYSIVSPFSAGDFTVPFIDNLRYVQDKFRIPWHYMLKFIKTRLTGEPYCWFEYLICSSTYIFSDLDNFAYALRKEFGLPLNVVIHALNDIELLPTEDVQSYHDRFCIILAELSLHGIVSECSWPANRYLEGLRDIGEFIRFNFPFSTDLTCLREYASKVQELQFTDPCYYHLLSRYASWSMSYLDPFSSDDDNESASTDYMYSDDSFTSSSLPEDDSETDSDSSNDISVSSINDEISALRSEIMALREENARLLKLIKPDTDALNVYNCSFIDVFSAHSCTLPYLSSSDSVDIHTGPSLPLVMKEHNLSPSALISIWNAPLLHMPFDPGPSLNCSRKASDSLSTSVPSCKSAHLIDDEDDEFAYSHDWGPFSYTASRTRVSGGGAPTLISRM